MMTSGNPLEIAANQMQVLVESNLANQIRGANEAKTRLLIIDEVLSILGWDKSEYEPEQITSAGSYTDYRLSLEGRPRLIVEAKRIDLIEPFPKAIQQSEYSNAYLYNHCGTEMKSLLSQCQAYCAQCGVPYALATTGEIWIILLGFRHGSEWGKLKAFVFHSLEDVLKRFNDFYGLVSREAITNNSLEEKFASMVLVKPRIAIRPRDVSEQVPEVGQAPHRQIIRAFFDYFMGDIIRPEQDRMLQQCYVENHEINEFSHELQQILQYDALLDGLDISAEEASKNVLEKELELQAVTSNPKTILLVGNVGAGKSTFIHRFVRHEARPKHNVCTIIDLINHSTKIIERSRAEEQLLADLVLTKLSYELQGFFDPYSPDMLRGCFEIEIGRFKKQRQNLQKLDFSKYQLEEEEFIYNLTKDKYQHLVGYLKYIRKKRYKVWIAFDNVDRGSDSYQEFIYSFAHQLSNDAGCLTLITLRQDTFTEAQEAGFLDVRSSDIIFHITAPEFRQVVSKRRRYVDRIIERNEVPRPFKQHLDLISLLNWHLTRLVLAEDNFVRLLITTFSLNNIRYSLAMLRDYYTSYHSTFHEFYQSYSKVFSESDYNNVSYELNYKIEQNRIIQALMLGNSWSYQEDKAEIFNIFSVSPLEKTSHFLMLRILAYLTIERNHISPKASIRYDKLSSDFISIGYQRHHIYNSTRKLLDTGLIISPNLPMNPVAEAKIQVPDPFPAEMKIAISGRGYYYLKSLVQNEYYQTRVGEDTIWYDKESAENYVKFLKDAINAQHSGSDDILQATEAKMLFIGYLRKSLLEENQAYLQISNVAWAQLVNEIVEQCVFGKAVTPIYTKEIDVILGARELLESILKDFKKAQTKKLDTLDE